jgi:hypothetical protein
LKRHDGLVLIAVWDFITALWLLIPVIAIAIFAFPNTDDAGGYFGLSIVTVVLLSLLGLSLAAGIGLLTRKEWGRILAIVHAAMSLIVIPVGTIIGALSLVYLTRSRIREYFATAGSPVGGEVGGSSSGQVVGKVIEKRGRKKKEE